METVLKILPSAPRSSHDCLSAQRALALLISALIKVWLMQVAIVWLVSFVPDLTNQALLLSVASSICTLGFWRLAFAPL